MTEGFHKACRRGDSSVQMEYNFIHFSIIHGHMPGAIQLFYWPHWDIKRAVGGLYTTYLLQFLRFSPVTLCPPGNLCYLVLVTCQGTGKVMGRCLICPLRAALTTRILSLNSTIVVCSHRPCRISIPKIYLGMEEIYTLYSFGGRCSVPNGIQACFTLIALPPYPSITAGVPGNYSGLPDISEHSAPVSSRTRTRCAVAGDRWIDISICDLWFLRTGTSSLPSGKPYSPVIFLCAFRWGSLIC